MKEDVLTIDVTTTEPANVSNLPAVIDAPLAVEEKKPKLGRKSTKVAIPIVETWLKYVKNHSGVNSVQSERTYRGAIGRLFDFFKASGRNIFTATEADIVSWRDSLNASKKPATVQLYMVATRLFYGYLCGQNLIAENPCMRGGLPLNSQAKVSRKHKRSDLSVEQIREMIEKMPRQTEMDLRNRAVVAIMATSGLRGVEVSEARCGNMRNEGGYTYLFLRGKGNQEEESDCVKVDPHAEKMIREYWKARFKGRTPKDSDFMFTSTSRNRTADVDEMLSTRTIRTICKNAMKDIGLDDPQHVAHSLRHSACTIALEAGEALPDVKDMMRHKRLDTTLLYQQRYDRKRNNAELSVGRMIFGETK